MGRSIAIHDGRTWSSPARPVRGAAAMSLGAMGSKSSILALVTAAKSAKEGAVVMAVAKALVQLGDERNDPACYK